jgi:hypothetical protein
MKDVGRYRKAIVAVLGAAAVIGAELPPDAPGWLTGTFAALTALGVWAVRNDQPPRSRADRADRVTHTRVRERDDRPPFEVP